MHRWEEEERINFFEKQGTAAAGPVRAWAGGGMAVTTEKGDWEKHLQHVKSKGASNTISLTWESYIYRQSLML